MISRERIVAAEPDEVWEVLADGWLYPLFVVGASRMREVDASWPAPGARLHHSVGAWPLLLDDRTEVLDTVPGERLRLRAHGWPAGAAEVEIAVRALGPGRSSVVISEDVVAGPGLLVPSLVRQPQIAWRNSETLRRLALLVEGRVSRPATGA